MKNSLAAGDYIALGGYFALVLAVGVWFKANRLLGAILTYCHITVCRRALQSVCRHKSSSTTGYFLAGRSMHWFPVGASIFATDIGAPTFVGLAGNAAVSGIACVIYEWHAIYILIALAWIYVPVYVASGVFTIPEYLKKRFGGTRLQMLMSGLSFILNVPAKIAPEIFAGALYLQQFLGGLAAVIYTDTLQSVVILIGAVVLFGITWSEVGTWHNLVAMYSQAIPNKTLENSNYTCGFPRKDFMHIWRDPVKGDIPWTGAAFGLTLIGIWFWCSDQIIVQRSLSAKNMNHSKGGAVFASYLKLTPLFLWIIPGMISRILYPDEVACPDPESCLQACGNPAGCSNIAYPLLVVRKMPEGLRGLMLAGFLAALMSTLSSIFNSATTLFTMDIWKRFRKRATQRELMIVSRVVVLVLVIFSILWIPVMESANGGQIWNYIQTLFSCVSPPWCAAFLLAIFWKRTTEP
ncbi:sodium/glucose cotransporter 5, partial [Biomphalaria glabrata]